MVSRKSLAAVLAVIVLSIGMPSGYIIAQRIAVTSCKFTFNHVEIKNVDMPSPSSVFGSTITNTLLSTTGILEVIYPPLSVAIGALNLANKLQQFLSETEITMALFFKVENPSFLTVQIDRAEIALRINDIYLDTAYITKTYTIPSYDETIISITDLTIKLADLLNIVNQIMQDDFRITVSFDITSHLPTLLGEIPVSGSGDFTIDLIPQSPSVEITNRGSLYGIFDITITNRQTLPLSGTLMCGLLREPFWSADSSFINFLRARLSEEVYKIQEILISVDPEKSDTVTVDYSEALQPNANNYLVTLWVPEMTVLPYTANFHIAGFQSTTYGNMPFSEFQTIRSIIYYLKRDFGYLGNHGFQTSANFDVYWLRNGRNTDLAYVGEEIECSTTITTNMLGVLTLEMLKDKAFDEIWVSNDFTISEYEETFNQAFIVDPDQSYELWVCWGYFARAKINGYSIPSTSGTKLLSVTKVPTIIILDRPPSRISAGSKATFTGELVRENIGEGIAGVSVYIYDNDPFPNPDDLLASGITAGDGTFNIEWVAEIGRDIDNKLDVYARFEETNTYKEAISEEYEVEVYKALTTLTLNQPPNSTFVGSTVTFTGRLVNTDTGEGIAGATIEIYDRDPDFDDLLASGTTRSDGTFNIQWTAKKGDWYDNTTEIFAKFEETDACLSSQSQQYVIIIS